MTAPAPTLQMLWEDADPVLTLQERFGFDDARAVHDWLRTVLDASWGVSMTSSERIVMSDTNALAWVTTPVATLVVKWSVAAERFARLDALARLTSWLAARGLPVSAPLPSVDGRLQVQVDEASVGVQREVDAELLDTGDPGLVRAAGAALGHLHAALGAYPAAAVLVADDAAQTLTDRLTAWLASPPERVPEHALATLHEMAARLPMLDEPTQLVHGDFRAANILCDDTAVVAVLDFEEARPDHCVVDLARSAVLLGTRFHDWGPVSPDVRSRFLAGYESVRPLSDVERAWWAPLVLWKTSSMVPAGDDPTGWADAAVAAARPSRGRPPW